MPGNSIRRKLIALLRILVKLLVGWLVGLIRTLLALLRRWLEAQRKRRRHKWRVRCHTYPSDQWVRPDVYLYSQSWLSSQGMAVVWDNPDIELRQGGLTVSSHQLQPSTVYDLVARVHNRSVSSPAVGVGVSFTYRNWGIGGGWIPIGQTTVDVSVLGGAQNPALATVQWTTPPTAGHYCIRCRLSPPDDLNWADNEGQENTDVLDVSPGDPEILIPVDNESDEAQLLLLTVDSYRLPAKPLPAGVDETFLRHKGLRWPSRSARTTAAARPERIPSRLPWDWLFGTRDADFLAKQIAAARLWRQERLEQVVAANARGRFPAPANWAVSLPTERDLEPHGSLKVPFSFKVPLDAPAGHEQAFNISAFDRLGALVGGVTVIARVKGA
jgi:hypothetical protein